MPFYADGVYCATGFNGNGMMFGSFAAELLAHIVLGNGSDYQKLFDPCRIKPIDGLSEFVKENADVACHFIADRIGIPKTVSLESLNPGRR